jgi:uncharacterized membrane protein YciS (DUF1049 family)
MIESIIIAIVSITGLMLGWVLIQSLWRKTFQNMITDQDVLAERRTCGKCSCDNPCPNKSNNHSTL